MPAATESSDQRTALVHHGAGAAALVVLALALYGHSARYDFIYDDYKLVLQQPPPRSAGDFLEVFAVRHWPTLPYYRPVARLTMVVQKLLHGDRPAPFHWFNTLLMAGAGVAVYALFQSRAFGLRPAAAFLGSALVVAHPIASCTVYPICSGRETLLPAAFTVAAVCFYLKPGRCWYWLAMAAMGLALLSKEQAVVVPLMFLLADLLRLSAWDRPRRALPWLLRYAPAAAIVAAYIAARWMLFAGGAQHRVTVLTHPSGPLLSLVYALQTTVAPFRELVYEPAVDVWISERRLLGAIVAVAAVGWAAYRRWPELRARLVFWLGWILLALLPTANLLEQEAPFAERYLLLALVGMVGVAMTVGQTVCERPVLRRLLAAAAVLAVGALGAISFERGGAYRDNLTFHRQWVRTSPNSDQAHRTLGWVFLEQGRLDEAAPHLEQALRLNPASAIAYNNLGTLVLRRGDSDAARILYEEALRLDPNCAEAHANLATIVGKEGDLPRAAEHFRRALRVNPHYAEAANGLGIVLAQQGDLDAAIEQFRRALDLQPHNAEAHNNLANVLAWQKRWTEAAAHYRSALRLRPDYPRAEEGLRRVEREREKSE